MPRPQLKISVPKPCSENWHAMTPQAKGRFCASCATTVVDFSQFTDKQLLEYFANRSGKTCGRFSVSQLNRPVYAETLPKQNFFPRALAAVALFLGISSQTQAQNTYDHPTPAGQVIEKKASEEVISSKTVGKTTEKVSGDSLVISGRVLDSLTKEPMPFANVSVHNSDLFGITDIDGKFKIIFPKSFNFDNLVLEVNYVGFDKTEISVRKNEINKEQLILLNSNATYLGGMDVITYYKPKPWQLRYHFRNFWWKTKNLFRKNDY